MKYKASVPVSLTYAYQGRGNIPEGRALTERRKSMWLVKKAQRADADAFVELIEQNKQAMYKVARSYLSCEDDIADAMSEAVLSAYEHLGELRSASYFKTWLIRILINCCNDILRHQGRCTVVEQIPEKGTVEEMGADQNFTDLVQELPKDFRMIFVLYYGEGFCTREIAELLDISENTVKSRLRRGRMKLGEVLQQQ